MKATPRAIRSITISFGLVNIPVKLFSTSVSSAKVHFHQLDPKTKHRVKQQLIDEATGHVVPRDQVERGYEYAKGKYVVVSDEELEALEAAASRALEISDFVPLTRIDPLYFDTAYFLGPDEDAARPYRLLVDALEEAGLAAVGQLVMRGKEQVLVMRPMHGTLVMHQLRTADEVRDVKDIPIPKATVSKEELALARQFIGSMKKDTFDVTKYRDAWQTRLKGLLSRKVKGGTLELDVPPAPQKQEHVDLLEALRASLGKKAQANDDAPAARKPARAAPHRRARTASKTKARKRG